MQDLIRGLLDYSRAGKRLDPAEPIDSGIILSKAISDLETAIGQSGAVITRDALPLVLMAEVQLTQIFKLLGNPSSSGGSAAHPCVGGVRGRWWRFAVADDGIGIKAEYRETSWRLQAPA